ncbi:hypothetical protein Tco_0442222 [Tanacetum coccineum]
MPTVEPACSVPFAKGNQPLLHMEPANKDSSAPQGVRHGKALEGAPPVDPHKLGGAEGGLKFMMGLRSEDGLVLETEERHKAGLTPKKELWVTISLAQGKPSLLHIKWNEEVNGCILSNTTHFI